MSCHVMSCDHFNILLQDFYKTWLDFTWLHTFYETEIKSSLVALESECRTYPKEACCFGNELYVLDTHDHTISALDDYSKNYYISTILLPTFSLNSLFWYWCFNDDITRIIS